MVFYRKYRPRTLEELDHAYAGEKVTMYLSRGEIPHAFILSGPKGTGKTSTARIIAKSINCTSGKSKGSACGVCDICQNIARGNELDVLEIDAASNRGIDEIRELRDKIKLTPLSLGYKVYIIDEVHMLTNEAFNALLKTLEEPPRHAVFILATTELHKVPETILSRCVKIEFQKATDTDMKRSLMRIITGEKLSIDEDALTELVRLADGSFRDGAKILEELSHHEGQITKEMVNTVMGTMDKPMIDTFLQLIKEKKVKELLEYHGKLETSGKSIKQFYLDVLKNLQLLLIQTVTTPESDWEKQDLISLIRLLSTAYGELKFAVIPSLPFELALVEYCEGSVSENKSENIKPSIKQTPVTARVTGNAGPLASRWEEFLERLKPHNHSIVGVLRSCQPISLTDEVLTIEAAYKFHAERLSESKVRESIAQVINEMMGKKVKLDVVIKKRN